jgi:molybdopterin-binding protein
LGNNGLNRRTHKISARNQLKGTIVEVKKGTTTAPCPDRSVQVLTAAITNVSVDNLKLATGQTCGDQGKRRHDRCRVMMRAIGFLGIALVVAFQEVSAAEDGCEKFAWSLARERE